MRVLDVGGGLGGPARMLAVEYGAHVTVLDLTADYLCAGALLTARMGLTVQVHLCCGHALNLPFPDGSFDLVWTQNSGMQIAHKVRLYHEFFRVLRPAGRLAQLEPIAGPVQPPHFPLMWAREAADSHCSRQTLSMKSSWRLDSSNDIGTRQPPFGTRLRVLRRRHAPSKPSSWGNVSQRFRRPGSAMPRRIACARCS